MKHKIWEVLAIIIVTCLAARLVLEVLEPFIPYIIVGALMFIIGGNFWHRRRDW